MIDPAIPGPSGTVSSTAHLSRDLSDWDLDSERKVEQTDTVPTTLRRLDSTVSEELLPDFDTQEEREDRGSPLLSGIDRAIGGLRQVRNALLDISANINDELLPGNPSSSSPSDTSFDSSGGSSNGYPSGSRDSSLTQYFAEEETDFDTIMAAEAFDSMRQLLIAVQAEQQQNRAQAAQQAAQAAQQAAQAAQQAAQADQQAAINQAILLQLAGLQNSLPAQTPVRAVLPAHVTYSGAPGECYLTWVRKIEEEALIAGWDTATKHRAAISSLRGPALQWHQQSGPGLNNWIMWEAALRAAYHVPLKLPEWSWMVENRLQRPGEPTRDYVRDKNDLILRCPNGIVPEVDRIPMFIRGLLDGRLQSAFLAVPPVTVNDFLAQVRAKEEAMTSMIGVGMVNMFQASLSPLGAVGIPTCSTPMAYSSFVSPSSAIPGGQATHYQPPPYNFGLMGQSQVPNLSMASTYTPPPGVISAPIPFTGQGSVSPVQSTMPTSANDSTSGNEELTQKMLDFMGRMESRMKKLEQQQVTKPSQPSQRPPRTYQEYVAANSTSHNASASSVTGANAVPVGNSNRTETGTGTVQYSRPRYDPKKCRLCDKEGHWKNECPLAKKDTDQGTGQAGPTVEGRHQ